MLIGASLSEPQYSQEWYVRQVHENILNKNSLPHTVAECVRTYHPIRKSILKEYSLPHTVVEWHVRTSETQKVY